MVFYIVLLFFDHRLGESENIRLPRPCFSLRLRVSAVV
jgi:hypothetical protein